MLDISESTLLNMLPIFAAAALIIATIAASATSERPGEERPRNDDSDWRR